MISDVPMLCPIVPYAFPVMILGNDELDIFGSDLSQLRVQPLFGFQLRVQTLFWALFCPICSEPHPAESQISTTPGADVQISKTQISRITSKDIIVPQLCRWYLICFSNSNIGLKHICQTVMLDRNLIASQWFNCI
jgi:hypothetical protein